MRDELIEAVAQALADLRGYGISNQDRRNAQAALAVIEARGMLSQGWRDIESAPRDGTRIYAKGRDFGKSDGDEHFVWAVWELGEWLDADDENTVLMYLTHWQPLPAPPVAAAEGGE